MDLGPSASPLDLRSAGEAVITGNMPPNAKNKQLSLTLSLHERVRTFFPSQVPLKQIRVLDFLPIPQVAEQEVNELHKPHRGQS